MPSHSSRTRQWLCMVRTSMMKNLSIFFLLLYLTPSSALENSLPLISSSHKPQALPRIRVPWRKRKVSCVFPSLSRHLLDMKSFGDEEKRQRQAHIHLSLSGPQYLNAPGGVQDSFLPAKVIRGQSMCDVGKVWNLISAERECMVQLTQPAERQRILWFSCEVAGTNSSPRSFWKSLFNLADWPCLASAPPSDDCKTSSYSISPMCSKIQRTGFCLW